MVKGLYQSIVENLKTDFKIIMIKTKVRPEICRVIL